MKNKLLIVLFICCAISACDFNYNEQPDEAVGQEPEEGEYFIKYEGAVAPSIFSQYQTYYIAGNEVRTIFVYGKDTKEKIMNEVKVERDDGYPLGEAIGNPNTNDDMVYNNERQYTLPVNVNGAFISGDGGICNLKVGASGDVFHTSTFEAIIIDDRELEINEYYIQKAGAFEYDLLKTEHNVNPKAIIENVFQTDANISVDFPTLSQKLYYEATIQLTESNYESEMAQILFNYSDFNEDFNDPKHISLFSFKSYSSNDLEIGGFATTDQDRATAIVLFIHNIAGVTMTENGKKSLVVSTLHELGHARGKFLTSEYDENDNPVAFLNPYGDMQGLTNNDEFGNLGDPDYLEPHKFGHFGDHSNACIMHWPSLLNSENQIIWRDNPHFCEGHRQMLLNTTWND